MTEYSSLLAFARELDILVDENQALKIQVETLKAQPAASRTNNRKKLTKRDVKDIRAAHRGGATQASLADAYDVNPATVSRIVRGIYHS